MEIKKQLKAIISHIISENSDLCDIICSAEKPFSSFIVNIDNSIQSFGSKSNGQICLGLGNIILLHQLCCRVCEKLKIINHATSNIFTNKNTLRLCVEFDSFSDIDKLLYSAHFLDDNVITSADSLTVYAMAYTLYHEFGHIKYDDAANYPLDKERQADWFANETLAKMIACSQNEENASLRFWGGIIDVILILFVSKHRHTEISGTHPHPIERLYNFLEFFKVDKEDCLWDFAFYFVKKWLKKNNIIDLSIKDNSLTTHDKFLDIYLRFKK